MTTPKMDWDLENQNYKLQSMITVYEEHIKTLEKENKSLNAQVLLSLIHISEPTRPY